MKNDESQMQPIQDNGQSPSAAIQSKRNSLGPNGDQTQTPPVVQGDDSYRNETAMFRNHQVNYSFGQPQFKDL